MAPGPRLARPPAHSHSCRPGAPPPSPPPRRQVGVRDLVARGVLRLSLQGLLDTLPIVRVARLSFVEPPLFSCEGGGGRGECCAPRLQICRHQPASARRPRRRRRRPGRGWVGRRPADGGLCRVIRSQRDHEVCALPPAKPDRAGPGRAGHRPLLQALAASAPLPPTPRRPLTWPDGLALDLSSLALTHAPPRPEGLLSIEVLEAVGVPRMDVFGLSGLPAALVSGGAVL